MSLQLAAQHLQSHGRGEDNQLVHMTTGELEALQKLAQAHGGSLTLNPHTGLPEAGFLSSALPMIAGFALDAMSGGALTPLMSAGLIGAADFALTGSLGQGLMAGLGAWGGANLGSDIANFTPGTDPNTLVASGNSAASGLPQGLPSGTTALPDTASQYWSPASDVSSLNTANPINNLGGMPGAGPSGGYVPGSGVESTQTMGMAGAPSAPPASNLAQTANGNFADPNAIVKTSAATGSAPWGTPWDTSANFSKLGDQASVVGNNLGQFASKNWKDLASAALPIMSSANQPTPYQPAPTEKNPMHLKENPQWSGPTQPNQPNPYYTAQYTDYTKHPYVASMTAAGGGLMSVNNYRGGGDTSIEDTYKAMQDIQNGVDMMSPHKVEMPSNHMAYHQAAHDPSVYTLSNADYAKTNPLQHMAANQIKPANGLAPVMSLGSYNIDPANIAQQDINKQTSRPDYSLSAKEGGLAYADGGVTHLATGSQPTNYLVPNSGNFKVAPSANSTESNTASSIPAAQAALLGMSPGGKGSSATAMTPTSNIPGGKGGMKGAPPSANSQPNYNSLGATKGMPQAVQKAITTPMPQYGPQNLSPDFNAHSNFEPINTNIYIPKYANGGMSMAMGGLGNLGSYSDGGSLLKGPGDGVSDSIPASIGHKQPARLAEGEFVIPARIVSELGNGSTDAGAKRLYAMMDRVKAKRSKTKNIAADTKAYKYLPA